MNKRHHGRSCASEAKVTIYDGGQLLQGRVSNISHSGMLVEDLPLAIDYRGKNLELIVDCEERVFRLRAIPIWGKNCGQTLTLGLRLFSVPRAWYSFVDGASLAGVGPLAAQPPGGHGHAHHQRRQPYQPALVAVEGTGQGPANKGVSP